MGFEQNGPNAIDLHRRCDTWFNDSIKSITLSKSGLSWELGALGRAGEDEIYQMLTLIKTVLASEECDTSLAEILESSNGALIKFLATCTNDGHQQSDKIVSEDLSTGLQFCQLVFIFLGRLTRLYEPAAMSPAHTLEVVLPTSVIKL
ncbi:hypothetical protein N7488_002129 [Penicillium malachiteum]|nr:hypothetical protein N7488_002129 [Penicillium malachiteum]